MVTVIHEKFDDDDFIEVISEHTPPAVPDDIPEEIIVDIDDKEEGGAISESADKKKKNVKQTSVRLTFSSPEFKVLTMMALDQSDKTGKRVSVTKLLQNSANKLIKKGN